MDKISRQKIHKETVALNDTLNQMDLTDTLEENISSKIPDISHSNIFFWYISSSKGNKREK